MNRKGKILLFVVAIFVVTSVSAKYYKFVVAQDFYVSAELSCNPEIESCFVWDCNVSDEDCDQSPYKYIWKYAANVPQCNPLEEDCEELTCNELENDCEIIHCSEETAGEEEYCTSQ